MKSFTCILPIILVLGILACGCVTAPENGTNPRKEAELLTAQGFTQYMANQYNESVALYERALAIDPSYGQAWTNKAYAEMALKDYPAAIQSLDRAMTLDPGVPRLWNLRGEALMALQRYPEAIQSFDKALQYAPEFEAAKLNRENATAKMGK